MRRRTSQIVFQIPKLEEFLTEIFKEKRLYFQED